MRGDEGMPVLLHNSPTAYYTSDRYFDSCAHYTFIDSPRYPEDFGEWCTPMYTACAAGWIEGRTSAYKWYVSLEA